MPEDVLQTILSCDFVTWGNKFSGNGRIVKKLIKGRGHRPESRDISGNFKRTPSAKFETIISEPKPKQRKNGQNCLEWLTFYTFYKLLVSACGFCRRDVNKKYKTAGDSVDVVEVLAFSL